MITLQYVWDPIISIYLQGSYDDICIIQDSDKVVFYFLGDMNLSDFFMVLEAISKWQIDM